MFDKGQVVIVGLTQANPTQVISGKKQIVKLGRRREINSNEGLQVPEVLVILWQGLRPASDERFVNSATIA